MPELNEDNFELIDRNKDAMLQRNKLKFLEDRIKTLENALESHAKILARFQMTEGDNDDQGNIGIITEEREQENAGNQKRDEVFGSRTAKQNAENQTVDCGLQGWHQNQPPAAQTVSRAVGLIGVERHDIGKVASLPGVLYIGK